MLLLEKAPRLMCTMRNTVLYNEETSVLFYTSKQKFLQLRRTVQEEAAFTSPLKTQKISNCTPL